LRAKEQTILEASEKGREAIIRLLIAAGANFADTKSGWNGKNALHLASEFGQAAICRLLVDEGSPLSAKTAENYTALELAKENEQEEVVALLEVAEEAAAKAAGPEAHAAYLAAKEEASALEKAVAAMIDGTAPKGFRFFPTPNKDAGMPYSENDKLRVAINSMKLNVVGRICAKWAGNPLIDSCVSYCLNDDNVAALRLLVAALNDLDAINSYGKTVLHTAAESNQAVVCRVLIDEGASLSTKSSDDKTALDLAKECHKEEVVALLEEAEEAAAKAAGPEAHAAYFAAKAEAAALAKAVAAVIDGTAPKFFRFPTPNKDVQAPWDVPSEIFRSRAECDYGGSYLDKFVRLCVKWAGNSNALDSIKDSVSIVTICMQTKSFSFLPYHFMPNTFCISCSVKRQLFTLVRIQSLGASCARGRTRRIVATSYSCWSKPGGSSSQ